MRIVNGKSIIVLSVMAAPEVVGKGALLTERYLSEF